jgi:hypothetical protein
VQAQYDFEGVNMSDAQPKAPEDWRNFSTQFPIGACCLKRDGLKLLYRILNERQKEYRDKVLSRELQRSNETEQAFQQRKASAYNAFVVSVTISADNGERLTGNREEIFDDVNFPTQLRSVLYSTQSVPSAVLNHVPQDRATLFLDFSRPPMFDFSRLPTLPTPNESNFKIEAVSESWFAATKAKLVDFFNERRSGYEWLHRAGIYDILLFVIGLPMAVWTCARLQDMVPTIGSLDTIPKGLIYCYTFLATLLIFRTLFSYSRWVFPKIEIESEARGSPLRHRAVWAVVMAGILLPALYDVIKALVGAVLHLSK